MNNACQVDFYLLKTPGLDASRLACRLALMAWERGHQITVVTDSEAAAADFDQLLWEVPTGRFVPHSKDSQSDEASAPVTITTMARLNGGDLLINLCSQPLTEPARFNRLLEIVPPEETGLKASRDKYRYYREQGLSPMTHEITK